MHTNECIYVYICHELTNTQAHVKTWCEEKHSY